jgi:diguanylate cyclase (GGDEF)-like protein/PAS domain S-box-containing protein
MIKDPAHLTKTELLKEYQALAAREAHFRTIAEFSPVMLWMTDGKGKSQFFNQKWMKFTGFSGSSDPDRVWFDALHPDEREKCLASFQAAFQAQLPFQMEYQLRRNDGEYRWILDTGEPRYDESGSFLGYIGSSQDITERKQAEQLLQEREAYLNAIFIATPDAMLISDEHGTISMANQQAESLLGYSANGLLGLSIEALVPERYRAGHPAQRAEFTASSVSRPMGARLPVKALRKDGSETDIEISLSPIKTEKGMLFASALRDVTNRRQVETDLRISAAAFETHEAIAITDAEAVILRINQAFTGLTGYTAEDAVGRKMSLLKSGRHDQAFYADMWKSINNKGIWEGEIWDRRKNGEIYPKWLTITAVKDALGVVTHYVGTHIDITGRKAAEEQIKQLAFYDPLTQLPNRRLLQERLKHAISQELRSGRHLGLLMLDLDRFKAVNDSFGHLAGDELLQQVAERITARLRDVDMVARLGGDEFIVLLEDIAQQEDAARVAEQIIADLSKPFCLTQSDNIQIGASVGISLYPQHGNTPEALMDHADAALYQAKGAGRGCFAYFSEVHTFAARERMALEKRLRRAVEQQELRVYYQPQVDIASGCIVGAEALVRWQDPEEGLIPPIQFIPIAEETSLILEIGAWVLRETCRQGRQWLDQGLPPITLAVNVSSQQFRRGDICSLAIEVLKDTGFPASQLELEITETGLMECGDKATDILDSLRALGIGLAIDDFGTGYSSLAYLKHFPLDVLKIDKHFIDDIPFHQDDMEIATTIIAMSHTLGFKVLAEGVETAEQLAFLQEKGCDLYQGYIKSKPVPAEDFALLLAV